MLANKNPVAEYDQYYYGRREQYATVALLCTIIRTHHYNISYKVSTVRGCGGELESSQIHAKQTIVLLLFLLL